MRVEDIRRVVMVGAGTMGQQIAFQCAGHGFDVVLYDVGPEALRSATVGNCRAMRMDSCRPGRSAREVKDAGPGTQSPRNAIGPRQQSKRTSSARPSPKTPSSRDRCCPTSMPCAQQRTIFATNTSTLLPSQFAEATRPSGPPAGPALPSSRVDQQRRRTSCPTGAPRRRSAGLVHEFARRIGQIPIALHARAPRLRVQRHVHRRQPRGDHHGRAARRARSRTSTARGWASCKIPDRPIRDARRRRHRHRVEDHRLLVPQTLLAASTAP